MLPHPLVMVNVILPVLLVLEFERTEAVLPVPEVGLRLLVAVQLTVEPGGTLDKVKDAEPEEEVKPGQ